MNSQGEIALFRQRIDQEVAALRRLKYGFAVVASHEIIAKCYDFIGECYIDLAAHLGEQEAAEEIARKLDEGLVMDEAKSGAPIKRAAAQHSPTSPSTCKDMVFPRRVVNGS